MEKLSISVVIPTWNREDLVEALLASLEKARAVYKYGETEVIVVDSSEGQARERIMKSCADHDTIYLDGDNSVRKKRNKGIDAAKYEVIHFIDSDVTVCEEILNIHAETFLNADNPKIAGSFGLTTFVGDTSFWWKILEHTTYLDSFKFATMWPYQQWTIGNNVAFYKDVLIEIGKFMEDFPFKLGGDDLEMTYRVTKNGYLIKSAPAAECFHSRETWNHAGAIHNRTKRWGSMEYHIKSIHPELFVNCIPKQDVMLVPYLILVAILAAIMQSWLPWLFLGIWLVLYLIGLYFHDNKDKKPNPFFYYIGKGIKMHYHIYYVRNSLKHKDFECLYKEMSFSLGQTLFMHKDASAKLFMNIMMGFASLIICALIKTFVM